MALPIARWVALPEQFPIEQGLKLHICSRAEYSAAASRAISNRTRIETFRGQW